MGLCCASKKNDGVYKVNQKDLKVKRNAPQTKLRTIVNYHQNMEKIIDFWFQLDDHMGTASILAYDRESSFPATLKRKWFKPDPDGLDLDVRTMFRQDFINLEQGKYAEWEDHKDGRLAIVILCDQLSRMYYRNQKEQFKFDNIALRVTKKALNDPQQFSQYKLIEKLFLVFPLMHSEKSQDSEKLVELITEFISFAQERNYKDCVDTMASFLKAAQTFTQILTVYGRFPHRNTLLGRKSTPDELEYNKNGRIPEQKLAQFGLKPQKHGSSASQARRQQPGSGLGGSYSKSRGGAGNTSSGTSPNKSLDQYNRGLGQLRVNKYDKR